MYAHKAVAWLFSPEPLRKWEEETSTEEAGKAGGTISVNI